MSKTSHETIKKILHSVKIEVNDAEKFEKDIDNILEMFNDIKDVDVSTIEGNLHKKEIRITDLREDIVLDSKFRPEMNGDYFKVPNVSKRDL